MLNHGTGPHIDALLDMFKIENVSTKWHFPCVNVFLFLHWPLEGVKTFGMHVRTYMHTHLKKKKKDFDKCVHVLCHSFVSFLGSGCCYLIGSRNQRF